MRKQFLVWSRKMNNLVILVYECGPVSLYMCLDQKEGEKRVEKDEEAEDEGSLCMNFDLSPCLKVHVPTSEKGWKGSGKR